MTDKKRRVEIPSEIAAEVQFQSDRICCVCRQPRRPITLHHIDGDPSNSVSENIAVLCLDCHRETQIRGGFDRKLDVLQVRLYKADWIKRVEAKRNSTGLISSPDEGQVLRYIQLAEKSDEQLYEFEADYVLVGSADSIADSATNACITGFVSHCLQSFREDAVVGIGAKNQIKETRPVAAAYDSLLISHDVHLFTPQVLSLEFQLTRYGAGAAHPNHHTRILNFRLHPSMRLELQDIFNPSADYLTKLSAFCVNDLHKQKAQRGQGTAHLERFSTTKDEWILSGASAKLGNYQRFSLARYGVVIHFDPYHVGPYADGKYEVFVPAYELQGLIRREIASLLRWP